MDTTIISNTTGSVDNSNNLTIYNNTSTYNSSEADEWSYNYDYDVYDTNDYQYYDYGYEDENEKQIKTAWFYVQGIFGLPVVIIGLILNLLTIIVLVKKENRHPFMVLMFVLIACNMVYGTTVLFNSLDTLGLSETSEGFYKFHILMVPVNNVLLNISITASVYMVLIVGLSRMCFRKNKSYRCPCPKIVSTIVLCVGVLFLSCIVNIPMMMEYEHEKFYDPITNKSHIGVVDTYYAMTHFHEEVYLARLHPIMLYIFPFCFMLAIIFILKCCQKCRAASDDDKRILNMVLGIIYINLLSRFLYILAFGIQEHYKMINVNYCTVFCGVFVALAFYSNLVATSCNPVFLLAYEKNFLKTFTRTYCCARHCPDCRAPQEETDTESDKETDEEQKQKESMLMNEMA